MINLSQIFSCWICHLTFSWVQFLSNKLEFFVSCNNIKITEHPSFYPVYSKGSRKIAPEENCPPALILTLILNQTLTLTGGQFSGHLLKGVLFKCTLLYSFKLTFVWWQKWLRLLARLQCLLRDPCYGFLFIVFLIRIVEFDVNDIYIIYIYIRTRFAEIHSYNCSPSSR